jgi:hypothetical protein
MSKILLTDVTGISKIDFDAEPNPTLTVSLDQSGLERLDRWRQEVEPVVERDEAARHLIEIALDDANNISTDVAAEVVETIGNGIALTLALETKDREAGGGTFGTDLHRLHELFQQIGALLGVPMSQLQVFERVAAMTNKPDRKN